MKLSAVQRTDNVLSTETEGIDYGIDSSQSVLLYSILSQYSDPIGSIVREVTTNALDSHLEANTQKPIIVRLIDDNTVTGQEAGIEIEDFGVGLSPERIKTVYSRFLASTKRDSNDQHGAFGLGSKSPLAYTDMFTVITRYNGVEYTYIIHKGKTIPRIELFDKIPTTECNGTKVRVNFVGNSYGERVKFKRAIQKQLAYFDNVKYENVPEVSNDFKIYQGKHFIYHSEAKKLGFEYLHICLGKVYYPLDWSLVPLEPVNKAGYFNRILAPVALKFEIGDLPIIWNRENIEYSKESIKLIKEKFKNACEEIQGIIDTRNTTSFNNIEEYFKLKETEKTGVCIADGVIIPEGKTMATNTVIHNKYPHLTKYPYFWYLFHFMFSLHRKVSRGFIEPNPNIKLKMTTEGIESCSTLYYCEGPYSVKTNKYIFQETNKDFVLLKKNPIDTEREKGLSDMFVDKNVKFDDLPSNERSDIKKFMKEMEDYVLSKCKIYSDVVVPDTFIQKKVRRVKKVVLDPESELFDWSKKITIKNTFEDLDDKSVKFKLYTDSFRDLKERLQRKLTVYGFSEDSDLLIDTKKALSRNNAIVVIKIAKDKEKAIQHVSTNSVHVKSLWESKDKTLKREITKVFIALNFEEYVTDFIKSYSYKSLFGSSEPTLKKLYSLCVDLGFIRKENTYGDMLRYKNNIEYYEESILEKIIEVKDILNYYNLIKTSTNPSAKELEWYVKGKPRINPSLFYRLKLYKKQKQQVKTYKSEQ